MAACRRVYEPQPLYSNRRRALIRDGSVQRFNYSVRIYSGQELIDLLRGVGFDNLALYGDLDGGVYGPSAKRLIAVARK
jgi:hypothetical protein